MKGRLGGIACILLFAAPALAQYEDSGPRGLYFPKKQYQPAPIPDFESSRERLPEPILEDNKELLDLYWTAWRLAFKNFKKPVPGTTLVSNYLDAAFSANIFQWDTIFMMLFARYAHPVFPAIESLDNFYTRQHANGYICREIKGSDGSDFVWEGRENTVNPPLFSWAEMESYKVTGDKTRLARVMPALLKYAEWLETGRKKPGTKHGLYWQTGLGSGMDNSPRRGSGWVDMSAQMVVMYKSLADMADVLGQPEAAARHRAQAAAIAGKINAFMWDEADGLYYDVDDEGHRVKAKTIASFWPMLAGICDQTQARRLLETLKDPKTFWRTIPFPTLAADQKDYKSDGYYWLGGVWAPTNMAVIKGLDAYGEEGPKARSYREFATLASETYLDGMSRVFKKTGTLWENYSPDAYARGGLSKSRFVGWSGCGPIALLIEDVLGLRPDAGHRRLTWVLSRIDRHGIKRLPLGDTTATLVCDRREDVESPARITVDTDKPFELVVVHSGGKQSFALPAGHSVIAAGPSPSSQ